MAGFPQIAHFATINGEREKCVFIILSYATDVREARPVNLRRGSGRIRFQMAGRFLRAHGVCGGFNEIE